MARSRVNVTHGYRLGKYERAHDDRIVRDRVRAAMARTTAPAPRPPLDPKVKARRRAAARAARASRKANRS